MGAEEILKENKEWNSDANNAKKRNYGPKKPSGWSRTSEKFVVEDDKKEIIGKRFSVGITVNLASCNFQRAKTNSWLKSQEYSIVSRYETTTKQRLDSNEPG